MLELAVIGSFFAVLMTFIVLDFSILNALLLGYVIFFAYALRKNFPVSDIVKMSWAGIKTVKVILMTFVFIGMLTAVWRDCGTIPYIIYHSSSLISPAIFILITFLLCCLISFLTGTSVGTSATIGVICMTLANTMQMDPFFVGGAILSGAYFGDRCSPMSTSALLVSELTRTDIYANVKGMMRTSVVPFVVTCGLYLLLSVNHADAAPDDKIWNLFLNNFRLWWPVVLPAVLIIVLCIFKVKVRNAMAASVLLACAISLFIQNTSFTALLKLLALGFQSSDPQLAIMLNGGGIVSMLNVMAIVCISSCYAGIFEATGLLNGIKKQITWLSKKLTAYGSLIIASVLTGMMSCNQTLCIMLSHYLCKETISDNKQLAIDLENTAVVIAPLIPWSIASVVPLTAAGAPIESILAAFYLYLLPLWNWPRRPKPI